jgi:hypothetical protein
MPDMCNILDISWIYLGYILDISWIYLGYISDIINIYMNNLHLGRHQ